MCRILPASSSSNRAAKISDEDNTVSKFYDFIDMNRFIGLQQTQDSLLVRRKSFVRD